MLRHLRLVTLCLLMVGLTASGSALLGQSQTGPVATEFEKLHFRSIGPAIMSGRITDLAVYEKDPAIIYVATAHGGVWKTVSDGSDFRPIFDDVGMMSIGCVAVSQPNPDLVWVGTGEVNNRQTTSFGDGVYKSTDGGKTFQKMGLARSQHVARIVIDPTTTTSCSLRPTVRCSAPAVIAASSRRPTAAERGRTCSRPIRSPARPSS